ncbi:MAG: VWA domain-containing protein [Methanosarcinales archaeon]|nr:MAG: VWA domain-containing protein [Methanosarcinales archaeon]
MNRKIATILYMSLMLLLTQVASADTLNITAETYETFADNHSVNITIKLTNSAGHPVNAMRVNFTTTLGTLHTNHTYTNTAGTAIVNISSWDIGTAKITAETQNTTNTANVAFVVGPASKIVLTSVQEAAVNTTCPITATVYDGTWGEFGDNESKWRVMPNVTINFTATTPPNNTRNSPMEYYGVSIAPLSGTTNANGTITATIHLSSRAGGNVIDANVTNGGICEPEYRLIEGLPSEPAHLFVSADPQHVSADGADTSQVTGITTDEFLNPLCSTGSIRFNMTGSSSTMPLNGVGEALITLKPSRFTGNVTVNGTYINEIGGTIANITNETVVEFYAEEPARILVTADATRISREGIPGVNESVITATVVDKWGHVLWNRTVSFSTTLGRLTTTAVTTNEHGQATVTLQSATAGNATVDASTLNDSGYGVAGTITIQVMGEPFISVITTIEPNPVEPGGVINVTTTISGQGNITGTRYAAHAMLVLDRSGSMDPDYYAGTPLDVALVLDRSGSMKFLGTDPEQPMTDAKTAAKVFMNNLVSNAQVGVIAFEGSVTTEIGLTLLNSYGNKALVRDAINSIHTGGGTAIGDGLRRANDILTEDGRADAKRITILLTDGECTTGADRDCSQAILNANTNHITIYTIGLGSAAYIDEPLLQRVASETGGKYYNAPSSSELRSVYNSIAQEISDYDITEIEYGAEGFTPYNYEAEGTLAPTSTSPPYILRFGGYDLDYTGDCRIEVNGASLTSIPDPSSGDEQWKDDYEYDITTLVQNGANVISFYDPNDYTNAIRNVLILANGITIANYPAEVNLVDDYPYNCTFYTSQYEFNDTFLINETINDLKVLLQWENSTTNMDIELTSPGGTVYGTEDNTTGYYFDDREAVSIDLRAPAFDTYITSTSPDTILADETSFHITDDLTGGGEQESTIMQWGLPGAPTHNARLKSVTMYLRGITPDDDPGAEHRSINVYDLTTGYDDDPTWNCNDSSTGQRWASGSSFSSADNDSYRIDTVALTSSITDDVVEFNITSANWSGSRTPDWGKECNIILTGSGYGGQGADRFASSETDPSSHTYRLNGYCPLVTITYSIPGDTTEHIWIHPLSYTYPDTDRDTVENGNWALRVTGSGTGSERFNITTHIDKKSAAKLASRAFISSLDTTREDRIGLATYSYSSTNNTANQTSYICEGNQWEGYFTVNTPGIYYFNLTWDDASDLDLCLYDGVTLLNTSSTILNPEVLSATLSPDTNYRVVVDGTNVSGNDTGFTINVSGSPLREIMSAYYDSNSGGIPRYRHWEGGDWSDETSANNVGGTIRWTVMQSCPTRNETIMGTLDTSKDLNVQIWDGSSWGAAQQFTGSLDSYGRRGFDVAYEQTSGDAMVVYADMGEDDGVPRYQIWNGTGWTDGAFVNGTSPGAGDIWWVRLAADPNSDDMVLVTLDDAGDVRAQVWDGSNWGNPITITNDARAYDYQCFDVIYDTCGTATVVWADRSPERVMSQVWNGAAWSAASEIYGFTDNVYWIKLAPDPNSNNILMGALDEASDISVSLWNGSAWTTKNREIETATHGNNRRYFDVSFEQTSGTGMVVWSDNTHTPKYQAWNATDDSWSSESSASSTGTNYVSWVQLTPDLESDEIFLMTSDGSNDINIQKWDGSAWGTVSEIETSSIRQYECFDLTYSQQNTSCTQTTVNWIEWRAQTDNPLTDSIGGFNPINSSINSLTADGMTAIDEGLHEANDALTDYENGTIILMTDGIDNVGYHSMIAEAERAASRNTTIFTVGFGSTIDNRTLEQIAHITGGKYYPAQNASDLENIFVGIAGELGNYTAPEPQINVYIGSNTTIEGSFVNITYVSDSANVTYYNRTADEYWHENPSNPNITSIENRTILSWDVGNRPVPYMITVGTYWRVAYQLTIDNKSANSIPVIIAPSGITYDNSNATRVNETIPETTVTVQGNATPEIHTKSATDLVLRCESESEGPPTRHPPSKPGTIVEYAYKLTAELTDINESKVVAGTLVEFRASAGTLYNLTHPGYGNNTQLKTFNETTAAANNGGAVVWLCSDAPGTITIWAHHTPENGARINTSRVVTFHSLESPPIIPPAPNPRGAITLE